MILGFLWKKHKFLCSILNKRDYSYYFCTFVLEKIKLAF